MASSSCIPVADTLALGVRGQLIFWSKRVFFICLQPSSSLPPRPAGSYECVDPRWRGVALSIAPLCPHQGDPPTYYSAPGGRPLSAMGDIRESREMGPSGKEACLHSQHSPQRAQGYGGQE